MQSQTNSNLRSEIVGYITVEQLGEQPKEIQKVFLDWWEPQQGDLVYLETCGDSIVLVGESLNGRMVMSLDQYEDVYNKDEVIPLFTLQQLWDFIEDKINYPVTVTYLVDEYWIQTDDWWNKEDTCFSDGDKLQAFWKCACEVAKSVKVLEYIDQFIKDESMN